MTSPGGKAQKFGGDLASKVHLNWALSGAPRREQVTGGIAQENTYPSEIPSFRRWKHGKVVLPLPFRPVRGQKKKKEMHSLFRGNHQFQMEFHQMERCLQKQSRQGEVARVFYSSEILSSQTHSFPGPREESSKVSEKSQSLTFKNRKI